MRSVWPALTRRARVAVARGALSTCVPRRARRRRRPPAAGAPRPGKPRRARSPGVAVVVVPPAVGRGLRVALRRVLPLLLATERGDVEVAPGRPQGLVAAAVDEVGAEDPVAVAD